MIALGDDSCSSFKDLTTPDTKSWHLVGATASWLEVRFGVVVLGRAVTATEEDRGGGGSGVFSGWGLMVFSTNSSRDIIASSTFSCAASLSSSGHGRSAALDCLDLRDSNDLLWFSTTEEQLCSGMSSFSSSWTTGGVSSPLLMLVCFWCVLAVLAVVVDAAVIIEWRNLRIYWNTPRFVFESTDSLLLLLCEFQFQNKRWTYLWGQPRKVPVGWSGTRGAEVSNSTWNCMSWSSFPSLTEGTEKWK
jgi:hypothetical protein